MSERVRAHAPGRVNLIGDHTDYAGGLVLPMAIDLGTTLVGQRGHDRVALVSADEPDPAEVALDGTGAAGGWASYVAAVVAELRPRTGLVGELRTTLPIGSGLSSSAALEVAVALALLGPHDAATVERTRLAQALQHAEQVASGVPCGIMDQLVVLRAAEGSALLIDCAALTTDAVALPEDVDVVVVHSGEPRALATSGYGARRAEVDAATGIVGPLPQASPATVEAIEDPVLRRRARHVVSECGRVRAFAEAIRAGDVVGAGRLMLESHASLRDDHEVSTPRIDALVAEVAATPGVHGARLTGGGWGGCIVALAEPGALDVGWHVRPAGGATVDAV